MVESASQAAAVYNTSKATGRIGLDCEGVRLSRSGRVCLVQVCSPSTQSSTEIRPEAVLYIRIPIVRLPVLSPVSS